MIAVCDMGPLHYLVLIGCDQAAERRLIDDLSETLERLEGQTSFYIGGKARAVIESMNQRDKERKLPKKRPPPE